MGNRWRRLENESSTRGRGGRPKGNGGIREGVVGPSGKNTFSNRTDVIVTNDDGRAVVL